MPSATKAPKKNVKKSDAAAKDAKKGAKKAAPKEAAAKKEKGSKKKFGNLTSNQMKTLECLEDNVAKTRATMTAETGIQKGWAKLLGAATKGAPTADTLEGMGLVKSEKLEAQGEGDEKTPGGLYYTITKAGHKELADARKAKEAADKAADNDDEG